MNLLTRRDVLIVASVSCIYGLGNVEEYESTLKVEMVAGDQKRLDPISPVWGKEGSYKTTFYPTVATTFAFHLMGTINDVPVDLTFTCVPESGAAPAESKTPKKLSEGVTELTHAGKFGCALPKEDLGFPEKAPSLLSLSQSQGSAKDMGEGGYSLADFALTDDLKGLASTGIPIHLYQSEDDTIVSSSNLEQYIRALPSALPHVFHDCGHFLQEEFPELIEDIRKLV
jgi:hypothetical protein